MVVVRSLCVASALCAAQLEACGARSSIELIDEGLAGAWPRANPPDPALPAGGAGATAQGGSPAQAGSSAHAGSPAQAGSPGMAPSTCVAVNVAIDELRPALTLLVDQSLSMSFHYPDDQSPVTRWSLVGDALFDPTNGVVKRFEASVRFGIAFFTSQSRYPGGLCPILSEVPAATRNYAALSSLYRSLAPSGDTPTGDALQQVVTELLARPSHAPRAILLVTDGNPDTCAQPDPDEGQPQAVAAVERAFAAGIDLYVLGISNDIAGSNLQELANAGKGRALDRVWGVDADAAQPYHASDDIQDLRAQLADILNRIPLCEVGLQRDVTPAELSSSQVLLDGQPLTHSDFDGYTLKDSRHLAIVGKACDLLKSGGRQLSVRISCG